MLRIHLTWFPVWLGPAWLLRCCCGEDEISVRIDRCSRLLQQLRSTGSAWHSPMEIRPVAPGTKSLGVFVTAPVHSGEVLFRLNSAATLAARDYPDLIDLAAGTESQNELHEEAVLPAVLARERRRGPASQFRDYLSCLPKGCPRNLAVRNRSEKNLMETTLSSESVRKYRSLMRRQLALLSSATPGIGSKEGRWAVCTAMSRTFKHPSLGFIMMPFVDLINHGNSCGFSSDSHGNMLFVAKRALNPGDEVTMGYWSLMNSQLDFLTIYGFTPVDSPLVSFSLDGLPQRSSSDTNQLREFGCDISHEEAQRISLPPVVTVQTIQNATRCSRLWWYDPSYVAAAVVSGHADARWELPSVKGVRRAWLERDIDIVASVMETCSRFSRRDSVLQQQRLLDMASPELHAAIVSENNALQRCVDVLKQPTELLRARARALLAH